MDAIRRILITWLTHPLTLLVVPAISLLWLVLWAGNLALHENCTGQNTMRQYLTTLCIEEGQRNAHIIHGIFGVLLIAGILVTLVKSVLDDFTH